MPLNIELPALKRLGLTLSQLGTFVLTAFGGFYTRIAPPQDSLRFWPGFVSLVAGIIFIFVTNVRQKVLSVILGFSLVAAVGFPVLYYAAYQNLTAAYAQSQVICGTVYTVKGAEYASKSPGITKAELINAFAGQTAEIWTERSINKARLTLGLLYSLAAASLAFAISTALQKAKPRRKSS